MDILVLGGYGETGSVFCKYLLSETEVNIVIAGRRKERADQFSTQLKLSYPPERISSLHVDAALPKSLRSAFKKVDFVVVVATTGAYAKDIVLAALETGTDYLDLYYQQDLLPVLSSLDKKIKQSGRCCITQAGFHPGLPAAYIRKAATYFDSMQKAIVGMAMHLRVERSDALVEIVDSVADWHPEIYKDEKWIKASYYDGLKIDYGENFGIKNSLPMDMVEIRELPQKLGLKEIGVYTAGFNWFVDYIVFSLIAISHKIKKGFLRRFWAKVFAWGLNFSKYKVGVSFVALAEGKKNGKSLKINIQSTHQNPYDFTVIPVISCLKQYMEGSIRKPGLHIMGHLIDPDQLFLDMEQMGVKTVIQKDRDK